MNGIKRVMCCLLIGLMLINSGSLCVAAAEEAAPEKEIEPILQMEPVQQTVPTQNSQNTEEVLEESPTPEDPTEMPSVEGAKKDAPAEGNAVSGVEADSNRAAAVASANESEETPVTYETPIIDLATIAVSKSVIYTQEAVKVSVSVSNPASVISLDVCYSLNGNILWNSSAYNTDTGLFEMWFWPDSYGTYEVLSLILTGQNEMQQVFYNEANSSILDGSITLPEDAETYDLSALDITYIDTRISTMAELKDAAANAAAGETIEIHSSENFVVDESITIPSNVKLLIQSGEGSFTVASGVTLTTAAEFNCHVPMTVNGKWICNAYSICRNGLTITATGTVDSRNGWIDLYGTFTNEGTFVSGSRMQHTHLVSSVAEIRATLETIADGDCIAVNGHGEDLIVDQDLTIPKGVYLSIQSGANGFKIAEGVAFSTASSFNCHAPMTVAGTWQCTGAAYCYNGLHITSTGRVENRDYLQISDEYSNLGTLTTASTAATRLALDAYSLTELKAALAQENPDQMSIYLCVSGDMVLTEDITIPEGVSLHISEDAQLTVGEGVTFTTIGNSFSCSGSMTVDGTWINSANCYCGDSLTITSSGTLENSGTIEVYGDYIPNGTIIESAGHHIRVNYTVSTMEELLATIDKVQAADSITIESSNEAFIIDQSVTIPNGVRLSADRAITIGKGVTFTTIGGFDCYAPLTVDGTWKCSGHSYCYGGLSITSTGYVENNSNLYIYDSYDNQGTLIADSNWSTRLILRVSGKRTLKEDMTLSENLSLYIYGQTSDAALTVSEGVSLTTMGEFYCYIPLTVAGTWVNEGGSTCNSGLTITPTGTVDNARGWIHLNGALNNEGALTNSSGVYQTNTASSPEELTLAIEHTLTGGTIRVSGDGGDFVINKEMTIPAGITVEVYGDVQNLRIGTNLTIDAGATLRSEAPLVVEGTIYNYGAIGAKNGLHVPGKIHNYDYIRVNGELTGEENIVEYEAGFCSVYQEYSIDSEESLLAVLDSMDMKKWNKIVAADSLTLTKDTTIPAGVYLEIQSGTFRISENATLVTYNNLDIHEDMVVDGYWENRYTNYGGYCGIRGNLTAKNVIKNSGHIELYKYCQALAEGMIDSSEGSQGSVGCGITITSLDELRSITEKENCPRMSIIWNPAEPVVLDRDLTIPDGLRLYIEGESTFIIPTDVTLSIGEADVHLDAIDIAGALVNNGNVAAGTIIVSGLLENTGAISFTELIGCETAHIKNGGILAGEIDDQCMIESIARAGGAKNFRLGLDRNYAWEDIFANVQSGDSVYFDSLYDDCWLIVSGDTIIPDDVQISGLCTVHVLEGATLTTNGTAFSPYMMLIDGAWINNGSVDLDILTVNGTVRNNGQITVWEITGDKNVVGNAVVNQSSNSGQYVTILDLQEALDSAEPGETIRCNQLAYGNGDSTILNTDIVVPEGITLEFSSVSKVYLTTGHTLTVNGTLLMQQQLYVAGNLVVNGNVTVDAADGEGSYFLDMFDLSLGGIAVTDTGSCSVNGGIRVAKIDYSGQLISDPLSVLNGVDGSAFSARETDRYWYLANSSESAILCTVQNDDCTLRLLNETGCVWQSASVSDGVLITGVAPDQYTLEVSKPGYVTRCYAVDTGNMMDGPSVQLVRRGNINGACVGGIDVEITDLACLYQYLTEGKNEGSIQDETYFKAVADVNSDGAIDVYDLQGLYEAVSGVRGF